jgi:hypothetical protein
VLMSVIETCRGQARSVVDYVSQTLRAFGNPLLPRPTLLLDRYIPPANCGSDAFPGIDRVHIGRRGDSRDCERSCRAANTNGPCIHLRPRRPLPTWVTEEGQRVAGPDESRSGPGVGRPAPVTPGRRVGASRPGGPTPVRSRPGPR